MFSSCRCSSVALAVLLTLSLLLGPLPALVSGQEAGNSTWLFCSTLIGVAEGVPFVVSTSVAVSLEYDSLTATVLDSAVNGTRNISTPSGSSSSVLIASSSPTNFSIVSGYNYALTSITDPQTASCPFPAVCESTRLFTASPDTPLLLPSGSAAASDELTVEQLTVNNGGYNGIVTFVSETAATLGPSVAVVTSQSSLTELSYQSSSFTTPSAPSSSPCLSSSPAVPAVTAQVFCMSLESSPSSSYGAWSMEAAGLLSFVNVASINTFWNSNLTGETAMSGHALVDITGGLVLNVSVNGLASVQPAAISTFSYQPLPGANPYVPSSAYTQPILYQTAAATDIYGWMLQLGGGVAFPDGSTSSVLRLAWEPSTEQSFITYRGDQQIGFGNAQRKDNTVLQLFGYSPYVNRGVIGQCGSVAAFTPSRLLAGLQPSPFASNTALYRYGLYNTALDAFDYGFADSNTDEATPYVMQILVLSQDMIVSGLGFVSTQLITTRLALYALPAGQSFPSSSKWSLLAETIAPTVPDVLLTPTPYTIELPLNDSSSVSLAAGRTVAIVCFDCYAAVSMQDLRIAQPTASSVPLTLYPAQTIDTFTAPTVASLGSFASALPSIDPQQMSAAAFDVISVSLFLLAQPTTPSGSSYNPYDVQVVGPWQSGVNTTLSYEPSSSTGLAGLGNGSSSSTGSGPLLASTNTVGSSSDSSSDTPAAAWAAIAVAIVAVVFVGLLLIFLIVTSKHSQPLQRAHRDKDERVFVASDTMSTEPSTAASAPSSISPLTVASASPPPPPPPPASVAQPQRQFNASYDPQQARDPYGDDGRGDVELGHLSDPYAAAAPLPLPVRPARAVY